MKITFKLKETRKEWFNKIEKHQRDNHVNDKGARMVKDGKD